jgi:deoxyhypusine synthase
MEELREIKASSITGEETLKELLEKSFTAHLARNIKNDILTRCPKSILNSHPSFPELLNILYLCKDFYRETHLEYSLLISCFRRVYELVKKSIAEDYTIFLAFAGALTPADFGTSCLLPLIKRGIVDVITTTGANIYHEMQRAIEGKFYEYNIPKDASLEITADSELAERGYSRIYNIIFPEKDLFILDDFIIANVFPKLNSNADLIKIKKYFLGAERYFGYGTRAEFHGCRHFINIKKYLEKKILGKLKVNITTTELHRIIGEALEEKFHQNKNWLVEAKNNSIPIFCGAPQDSSLFLPLSYFRLKKELNFTFDVLQDINEMAAFQYLAQKEGKFAVIILGGGTPKNFTLQGEPHLKGVLGVEARGFDVDVQISMADIRDGGLSSCPANEGHTWGKVSEDGLSKSIFIKGEILSTFPLLVYAICQENLSKGFKRLLYRKEAALKTLQEDATESFGLLSFDKYQTSKQKNKGF